MMYMWLSDYCIAYLKLDSSLGLQNQSNFRLYLVALTLRSNDSGSMDC